MYLSLEMRQLSFKVLIGYAFLSEPGDELILLVAFRVTLALTPAHFIKTATPFQGRRSRDTLVPHLPAP